MTPPPNEASPQKDRFFNPRRIPSSDKARAIVADVLGQVQKLETLHGLRKRGRKAKDQMVFEATVTAIISDLMYHQASGAEGGIAITRSNRYLGTSDRYRHPALNKAMPQLLDNLARPVMAFIEQDLGEDNPFGGQRRTTIHPGKRLLSRMQDHGITLDDFGLQPFIETIVLKRAKENYWDEGDVVEYEDTPSTREYRRQMVAINEWLSRADLEFDNGVLLRDRSVDTQDRHLRRIFTRGSFECGGRLFGGFWQNLPKQERKDGIFINGEDVAVLDFGQMNPRILYGLANVPLPQGDLYDIPGLENCRDGIKKVMNSVFFADKPLQRFPKETRRLFPTSIKFDQVTSGIEAKHPALAPFFFSGIGHRAMFIESQVMVDLLLDLMDRGIVALPIHDAVVVPRPQVEETVDRMLSSFLSHTGVEGVVSEEGT